MFKLMSKVKRLMKIHVEIENEYINHVKNYIPEKDFKYENIELSENEYIQKNFLNMKILNFLKMNIFKKIFLVY